MASLNTLLEPWLAVDAARWTATAGVLVVAPAPGTVVGAQMRFTPMPAGSVTSVAATWDLTGAQLACSVTPPSVFPGSIDMTLHTTADPAGDGMEWSLSQFGGLVARYRKAGTWFTLRTLVYSRSDHQWWRIREQDGLVLWELSPDGIVWSTVAVWLPTLAITALRVTLRANYVPGDPGDPIPTGRAVFGPLNILPAPPVDPVTIISQDGVPYLAIDVQPDNITGTFLLGDLAVGGDGSLLDGDDRLGWSSAAAGAWENVVCDVQTVRLLRGVSQLAGPLTTVDVGLLTIILSDTERRFDPSENADAIHVGTPVRVRAWGYNVAGDMWNAVLFTGTIDDVPVRYLADDPPQVTLTATDLVAEMVQWRSAGRTVPAGAGDDLRLRAERLLAEMGQAGSRMALDVDWSSYAASHPGTALAQPWEELLAAQDAELGRVWVNAANQLVTRTRFSELSGPVRGTFSDVHGDADAGTVHCCYRDLNATHGTDQVTNRAVGARRVVATPPDPLVVTAEDTASVARWRPHVTERMALEVQTDAQTTRWAQDLVALAGQPEMQVQQVMPHPPRDDLDTALEAWPAVCGTDLGDRWVTRYHPAVGPVVDRTVGVLGILHEVTPQDWLVTFVTADATPATPGNPLGVFILDDSDLDSGDVLAPHTAQPAGFVEWTG